MRQALSSYTPQMANDISNLLNFVSIKGSGRIGKNVRIDFRALETELENVRKV
jgi:hypothetical protein